MKNLKQRKFKRTLFVALSLMSALSLSACKNDKEIKDETVAVETTTATEVEESNTQIENDVQGFYDEYLGFFQGLEDKNYTVDTVRNIKLLLDSNVDDLKSVMSYEEYKEALSALDDIYSPFDLLEEMNTQDLISINGLNYDDVEHTTIEELPRVSKLISGDDSTKASLEEIEDIRDEIASSVRNNSLDQDINAINSRIVDRYHDVIPGDKSGVKDTDKIGKVLVLDSANRGLLNLGMAANPETRTPGGWIYNDKLDIGNGQKQAIKINYADAGERIIITNYQAIEYFNALNKEGLVGEDAIAQASIYTGLDEEKIKELINLSNEDKLSLEEAYYNIISTMPVYFYDTCDEDAIIYDIYHTNDMSKGLN